MRQQRLDSFRLYAIFLIVCAHVQFFGSGTDENSPLALRLFQFLVVTVVRYSMPFFFILAGYFTGGKMSREPGNALAIARAYTARLGLVFLFWCLVYAVENPTLFSFLLHEHPVQLVLDGSRVHLWFMVSLILTVWLFALWPFHRHEKSFLWLGVVLYVVGLLAGSYRVTPLGFNLHFNPRDGVFLSTLFFAIGVAFSRKMPKISTKAAVALAAGGFGLYCAEVAYLRLAWGWGVLRHDFLLGTIPFGLGISLLALTKPDTASDKFFGPYGRYTLGIYASHILFLDLYRPIGAWVNPYVWQIIYSLLVFGSALAVSMLLARTPLRKMVL